MKLTAPQQELYDRLQQGEKIRIWNTSANTSEYHFDHGDDVFQYDLVRYRVFWNLMHAIAKSIGADVDSVAIQYFVNE